MRTKILSFSALILFIYQVSFSQSPEGLWGVVSVDVGDQKMTPVAKWFRYKEDGTCEGGNGWTKNLVGTWNYNKKAQELSAESTNGIKDEYGAFTVSFEQNNMIWNREEDGMKVTVVLQPIDEIPASPADLVQGLWALSEVRQAGTDVTSTLDPESKQFIHIRPDKRFRLRNPDGTSVRGFWHMNGHRPLLTLINDNRTIENQVFDVLFEDSHLIMSKRGEDIIYRYQRIFQFPN